MGKPKTQFVYIRAEELDKRPVGIRFTNDGRPFYLTALGHAFVRGLKRRRI